MGLIPSFHGLRLECLGPPFNCNGPTKKMAAFLESCSAKGSLSNNISQHVGSSTETHVPYQSNKNVNTNVENQTEL